MALLVPGNLNIAFLEFSTRFNDIFAATPAWWDQVAMEVPSAGESVVYSILDKIPRMRKWLAGSPRAVVNASLRSYALVNDDWELTLEIDRNKFNDAQYGQYTPLMGQMGEQAKHWPDDMIATLLQTGNAATSLSYDQQPFFSTSHPVNMDSTTAGTFSNYSATGMALTAANYNTVRATMMSYLGADGKPLGVMPSLLIVPPQLEQAGKQILNTDWIAPGAGFGAIAANAPSQNTLRGSAGLLVIPQLANAPTTWYLVATMGGAKPFIFQNRQAPQFQMYTSANDHYVFKDRKYVFGVDARGAAGFTAPFLAYSATA
jgi:phage major head subunit gpT-like protein